MPGPTRCRFLNEEHDISASSAWNDPALQKLWLYNLHYFDDLNAIDATDRADWHRLLIGRWVDENPPGKGTGWEPYPCSLRIVNWIKWALSGNPLEPNGLHSLAVQARWLAGRLEIHLLGNHLFANAKALVFAGFFFEGQKAAAWLEKGMSILEREIPEQILADGGHFERSTMYHALALEDMLDLANLAAAYPDAIPQHRLAQVGHWPQIIARMRLWLADLCHPDGEISFFNDAAVGIAPTPAELEAYAGRLGLSTLSEPIEGYAHYADSGYIRVRRGDMLALLDVAPVGPDYLPGHAHADTLSFELSLCGQRVLVNSGTSRYGMGPQRLRQRGTATHNTVTIGGQDSSEVWGGFRVARRARPFGLRIEEEEKNLRVICSHDGYTRLPGKPIHRREWHFFDGAVEITDTIAGKFDEAVSRLFFYPGLKLFTDASGNGGHVESIAGRSIHWRVEGASIRILSSTYHREFGLDEANSCLEMRFSGPRCLIRFTWD
ncbi:MAG: alginate lyase family protein [Methylococcaceae bacterium]|nr:alginate lyase family protein [Methylococcaceae bacterium]